MKIARDKKLHFWVNLVASMTAFFRVWLAVGLCIGLSAGKEYGDSKAYENHWDWLDIVADAAGMAAGLLVRLAVWLVFGI